MSSTSLSETEPCDVFLSHSTEDDSYVAEMESFIRSLIEGNVFNDVHSIPAGEEFWPEIKNAIHTCKLFYVIVSTHSIKSKWVKDEIELARFKKKRVIGLRIDDCDASALFSGRDVIDLRPGRRKVAKINTKGLPETHTGTLYGRDSELADLFTDLDDPQIRVVAFDAMGGTGKTALIQHFVQQLKTEGWRDIESVFIWSFYSQGSSEDKQTHAADFFKAAFHHFHPDGKDADIPKDLREQGEVLAVLIAAQPSLLVLDGLEPLQYAAGGKTGSKARQFGGIKDPGVKVLLSKLADIDNGLTIVTTRIKLRELAENSSVRRRKLAQIPTAAAIDLLRDRGIEAASFPRESHPQLPEAVHAEFVKAIEGLENHALSLNIAAHIVAENHGGQIKAFKEAIIFRGADDIGGDTYRSAFRVIRAFEVGLFRNLHGRLNRESAAQILTDCPSANQLALCYFLGLFDRPAALDLLPVVYDSPPELREALIPGDKAEFLAGIETAAAARDAVLNDPNTSDDDRLEAREAFETYFYAASFNYWMEPIFATFDPKVGGAENCRVTNALQQLSDQGLVAKARLVSGEGGRNAEWKRVSAKEWITQHVDCHPLIREYFGYQLRRHREEEFEAAHGRLYDHYRYTGLPEAFRDPVAYGALVLKVLFPLRPVEKALGDLIAGRIPDEILNTWPPSLTRRNLTTQSLRNAQALIARPPISVAEFERFLPSSAVGMEPLYSAIRHGCRANRHNEAWDEVYFPRISRCNENFSTSALGLYGQDLEALANFFDSSFITPHPSFCSSKHEILLNFSAYCLRVTGRYDDSSLAFMAAAQLSEQERDYQAAATNMGNLSEVLIAMGNLIEDSEGSLGAVQIAERSLKLALRHGTEKLRQDATGWIASSLFAAGRIDDAESYFKKSEAFLRSQPERFSVLFSLDGFHYGDLLLDRRRIREVEKRSLFNSNLYNRFPGQGRPLGKALGILNLTCARSLLGTLDKDDHFGFVSILERSNREDYLALAYLSKAKVAFANNTLHVDVAANLNKAESIAKSGPMPLLVADVFLFRARLCVAMVDAADGWLEQAMVAREEAAKLIADHHYGRREPDLAVLDAEICQAGGFGLEALGEKTAENEALERAFVLACDQVAHGWWHLIPRLEVLAGQLEGGPELLQPILDAEAGYHAERDAYLAEQAAPDV